MITFYTRGNTNIRSEPRKTERKEPSNVVATLPTNHWFMADQVVGDWVRGTSIIAGKEIRGFAHSSLLKVTHIDELGSIPSPNPGIIKRHDVFYEEAAERLRPYLTINPPQESARPQESVSFKRSRNVYLEWAYIFGDKLIAQYTGNNRGGGFQVAGTYLHFRRYFERIWSIQRPVFDTKKVALFGEIDIKIPRVTRSAGGEPTHSMEFRANTLVLKHPLTDRMFLLTAEPPIAPGDFADYDAYSAMWERVTGIEYCFPATELDDSSPRILSSVEELDLGPAIITRQYREFEDLRTFATDLSEKADSLAKEQVTGLLSELQINYLLNAIMRMKQPLRDLEFGLRRLVDKASDLNYILPLEDQKFTYPDKSELPLEKGKLYQPYRIGITWTTDVVRTREYDVEEKFLGIVVGRRRVRQSWTERVQHYQVVEKYGEVKVDLDPWEERELALAQSEGLTSYRFERIGSDYATSDGIQLQEVMDRCERDEHFRRSVAVWIPSYEQKLTSGEILTRYTIYKRPFPGYTPVRSPMLYIHEGLSYRTGWRNSELGELVHSVNMGPGEERTITIEQSSTRQIEDVRSATSILDLTQSESLELSTEIEKEASSSNESTRTSSMSATASGSYGVVGGSVSGSTSSSQTAKQFARQMEKVARKAASNMTRKSTQEVRSSTTVKTNVSRSESTSINIKNINEGRTLNILFYRLYNIFTASLVVDGLQLVVDPSNEVVHGSGVTVPRVYEFSQLDEALGAFDFTQLAYAVRFDEGTDEYTDLFIAYWSYIIDQIIFLLGDEYGIGSGEGSAGILMFSNRLRTLLSSVSAAKTPRLDAGAGADRNSVDHLYDVLRRELEKLIEELQKAVYDGQPNDGAEVTPLIQHDLRVASPGLYVDTLLGVSPATEPYAEEMRAQKVLLEAAEVSRQFAIANYYRTLSGDLTDVDESRPIIVGRRETARRIVFKLGKWYRRGTWSLYVDAAKLREFDSPADGESPIALAWDADVPWLDSPEGHVVVLHFGAIRVLLNIVGPPV